MVLPVLAFLAVALPPSARTRPLAQAELSRLRISREMQRQVVPSTTPGYMSFRFIAQIKNESRVELAAVYVRMVLDVRGKRAYASKPLALTRFVNFSLRLVGPLQALEKSDDVEDIAFDAPRRLWRADADWRMEICGASTFVNPDLHDAGHLYARLIAGTDAEEIAVLRRDPSLLRVRDETGLDTTLIAFACCGADAVRYVLAHGGDRHARTRDGSTIMHMAALNPRPGVCDLALRMGGNVNASNQIVATPLSMAIQRGSPRDWNWLLAHGADPRNGPPRAWTPAEWAILQAQPQAIKDLVRAGASPRAKDRSGWGWLHIAVNASNMVPPVLAFGVPVDDPNPRTGETPLMKAEAAGWRESAQRLLAAGADPRRKDHRGRTAFDYASLGVSPWPQPLTPDQRATIDRENALARSLLAEDVRRFSPRRSRP